MNDSTALVLGLTSFLLFVIVYVWLALALGALFRKAGEEPWKGWVPFLNVATVLKLGGLSPWLVLLAPFPVLNIVFAVLLIIASHRVNRSFGFDGWMTVLAAFFFVVWASVLGFGSARWLGEPAAAGAPGPMRGATPPAPAFPAGPAASTPAPVPGARVAIGDPIPEPVSWAPQGSTPPPPPPTVAVPVVAGDAFPPPPPPPAGASMPAPHSLPLDDDLEDSAVDPEDRIPAAARRSGSFLPPAAPPAPPAPVDTVAPIASVPGVRSAAPRSVADAPVTDVPPPPAPAPVPEPWAPSQALRTPELRDDAFPEDSAAVSAVVGAPDAGSPRSARSSVSALYAQPEIPADLAPVADAHVAEVEADLDDDDDLDAIDQTVIARRRRIPWALIPPGGSPIDISADVVILGRRPAADAAHPGAQLISIADETRTVSKTHARLELRGETWYVTDLGSTNGVLFATLMGTEVEAQPGQEIEAGERFFLGDAEVRLTRSEG